MALSLSPSTASVDSSRKQIIISVQINTVAYTVPAGKTFTGEAITAVGCSIVINGTILYSVASGGANIPLVLVPGTIVSGGTNNGNWVLFGIES